MRNLDLSSDVAHHRITQIRKKRTYLCLLEQLENILAVNRTMNFFSAVTYQMTNHVWILHEHITTMQHDVITSVTVRKFCIILS